MDPALARRLHAATNTFHGSVYFAAPPQAAYQAIGLEGRSSYFAPRAAAMGAVPAEVVEATFYNFNPAAVRAGMAGVWDAVGPAEVQAARFAGMGELLDDVVRPATDGDAVAEAVDIAGEVVAGLRFPGRPLAGANAAVALPGDPLLALWQLVTVIREWRGDAHVAVLVAEALDPVECLVIHAGIGAVPAGALRATRQWPDADWDAAVERLGERGWVESDGTATEAGEAAREDIEVRTDELSVPMWATVGPDRAGRLAQLLAPMNQALIDADVFAAFRRAGR